MRRRSLTAGRDSISFWPSFADVTMAVILILVLLFLLQLVGQRDVFSMDLLNRQKKQVWGSIQDTFHEEVAIGRIKQTISANPQADDNDVLKKTTPQPQFLTITFSDQILFETGEFQLKPQGRQIILQLATVFQQHLGLFRAIKVQGHTDDQPFRSADRDNWDLSADRAKSVVRTLIEGVGVADRREFQARLVAAGYSEFHPIAPNQSDEVSGQPIGNELNRRIDIELEFYYSEGSLR